MKWDSREYWLKSKVYQARAIEMGRDDSERSFWRSLALEHLLRAALTHLHPALNADPQNEGINLLYAFGIEIKGEPRTIPIHAVTARLERIIDGFQKPHREFCDYMMLKRNEEVHTCELSFEGLGEATWLPHYYEVCQIVNEFAGHSLDAYLGEEEANTARQLISARHSAKRGEIEKRVAEHRAVFRRKQPDEQASLASSQTAAATGWPHPATHYSCPACTSDAHLIGSVEGTSEPVFRDGELVVQERYLASSLTCGACGLQLHNIEELVLANVRPHYTLTVHTDLHEFYNPDDPGFYMNM
jgi:hypothetical protein